jgi:hypothetical protein
MKSLLSKPYPIDWSISFLHILKVNSSIGLFVTFFLYLFKPSSIIGVEVDFTFLECFVYGVISFLVPTLIMKYLPLVFPKFSIEETWNVGKQFILNFSIIFFIAFFIILYGISILGISFKIVTALRVFWLSILIGVVPTFGVILFNQNRLLKSYLNSSEEINGSILEKTSNKPLSESNMKELIGEGKNEVLTIDVTKFLFASSQSNYCEVFYIQNNKIQKELIRISLSNLYNQLADSTSIEKIHRSYIANLLMVINVTGNAQGYKLHFEHLKETVPVSRSLSKEIKNKIILG